MNSPFSSFALRAALALTPSIALDAQAQTATPTAPDAQRMETVEVVGRRDSGDYWAQDAQGTKTELPLREVPQSVRVITRQTLDDLGATRLDDALDYAGGVSRQNHFGGLWDNVAIRGLAGDINSGMSLLRDGFASNRGFHAPRELANVERIEFLKGPVSSLYGVSEPGGTVNIVTKQPQRRAATAVEAYGGSFDAWRTTLDTTGPISDEWSYRVNAATESRGNFRDFVQTDRNFLAPALRWQLAPGAELNYSGEWLRHTTPLDRGIVATRNVLGEVPRERFTGEPADGRIRMDNSHNRVEYSQAMQQAWKLRASVAHQRGTLEGFSTEPAAALQADERTLRRQRRFRDYDSTDTTWQIEAQGTLDGTSLRHEWLVGATGYSFEIDQLMLRINPSAAAPYAIDVLTPVYGQAQPTPGPNTDTNEQQRGRSFYAQWVLAWGQWRALAGLRADQYDQQLFNRRTNLTTTQDPARTSPRAGLSYLLSPQWTAYANWGRSFRPNSGLDRNGSAFAPELGRAAEAGFKWESATRQMGATLAAYRIDKRNVLTTDPVNNTFSISTGQVRSQGVDVDVSGQLSQHWRLNASLSYIDAQVVQDNTFAVGSALLNIPQTNASLLVMYEGRAAGTRFGVGAGVTHTAKRLGEAYTAAQAAAGASRFELPAYTLGKLTAYWRPAHNWRLTLDIDNLLDEVYYTNSFQRTWVMPGAARTLTAGAQFQF
jgi:iron complex outermembrane recepter protein